MDGFRLERGGWFHGHERKQLHHVVLDHVADRAGIIVVTAAAFHAEGFGNRDLDVIDVFLVPERFEDLVGEPQGEDVLDGLLAEIVVDAENLPFRERAGQRVVQLLRGGQTAAKRFLDDDALRRGAGRFRVDQAIRAQLFDDADELRGGGGEIKETIARRAALGVEFLQELLEFLVARGIAKLRLMVKDRLRQRIPHRGVDRLEARGLGDGVAQLRAELVVGLGPAGEPDDGKRLRELAFVGQIVEGRDKLAVGEVTRRAKDHQRARLGRLPRRCPRRNYHMGGKGQSGEMHIREDKTGRRRVQRRAAGEAVRAEAVVCGELTLATKGESGKQRGSERC